MLFVIHAEIDFVFLVAHLIHTLGGVIVLGRGAAAAVVVVVDLLVVRKVVCHSWTAVLACVWNLAVLV